MHGRRLPRVAGCGFRPVAQFTQPGFEELPDGDPVAVRAFVVGEGAQFGLAEGTDAVPQVTQGQLVVVGQRKVVVGHAFSHRRSVAVHPGAGRSKRPGHTEGFERGAFRLAADPAGIAGSVRP